MLSRVGVFLVVVMCCAGLLGCVSADVYRMKEQEVLTLHTTNQEMQGQNQSLIAEKNELQARLDEMKRDNEGLKERIEKQGAEAVYLISRAEKLEKESEVQRERMEKLNAKIADLNRENQRLTALTLPENLLRSLGERMADLKKQVEVLSGENEILKNKQVNTRPQEEKTGGAGDENAKSAGEKPHIVPVSAEQKAEESKPDQQRENWRQPALSEYREKPSTSP